MYLLIVLSNASYLVFFVNMINYYFACVFVTTRDLLNAMYILQRKLTSFGMMTLADKKSDKMECNMESPKSNIMDLK